MKTTTANTRLNAKTRNRAGLKVRAAIKAGGVGPNHNRAGLKVRAAIKAGGVGPNHNRAGLKVKTAVRGGYSDIVKNHNWAILAVR